MINFLLFLISVERKWEEITDFISTDLRADSTNTLNAFKWIQATNTSLKFSFSQRTKIPWGRDMQIYNKLKHRHTYAIILWAWCMPHILLLLVNIKMLNLLLPLLLKIKAVLAHVEPVWIIGYTMVIDTDNTALNSCSIFWQFILLTCSPGLWLWIHKQLFWRVSLRKCLPFRPRPASWWCWSHKITPENQSYTWQHAATSQAEENDKFNYIASKSCLTSISYITAILMLH